MIVILNPPFFIEWEDFFSIYNGVFKKVSAKNFMLLLHLLL